MICHLNVCMAGGLYVNMCVFVCICMHALYSVNVAECVVAFACQQHIIFFVIKNALLLVYVFLYECTYVCVCMCVAYADHVWCYQIRLPTLSLISVFIGGLVYMRMYFLL